MTTLAEAREQYRRWAARTSRRFGTLSEDQRSLQMAVRVAYADLRLFNQKHPRFGSPRSLPAHCRREAPNARTGSSRPWHGGTPAGASPSDPGSTGLPAWRHRAPPAPDV